MRYFEALVGGGGVGPDRVSLAQISVPFGVGRLFVLAQVCYLLVMGVGLARSRLFVLRSRRGFPRGRGWRRRCCVDAI